MAGAAANGRSHLSRFSPARWAKFPALWRGATFLLALVSFGALYSTGELGPQYVLGFFSLWALALAIPRAPRFWRPWMGVAVAALAFAAFVVELAQGRRFYNVFYLFIALAQDFNNIINLLLFILIYKLFTLRTSRDYLQVQMVCFFCILATAMVTVSFSFSFFFLAYLLVATLCLVMYAIASRGESAAPAGAEKGKLELLPVRRLPLGRLIGGVGVLSAAVLALVVVIFFLVPHYSLQKLDAPLRSARPNPQGPAVTGFSEEVQLGSFKGIEPDPTVVMRIEAEWEDSDLRRRTEGAPLPALRIRGVALDQYEDNRWRRARGRRSSRSDDTIITSALRAEVPSTLDGPRLRQKIYQNPNTSLRLFAASYPDEIYFERPYEVRVDSRTTTFQIVSAGHGQNGIPNPFVYHVNSPIIQESTPLLQDYVRELKAGVAPELSWRVRLSRWQRRAYLQLPEDPMIEEIRQLAEGIAPGPTDVEKVVQATQYLRQFYSYSLEPPEGEPGVDPLRAFLFGHRQGHCEYFATSLVLMLRGLGIPARMVNGFYTTEWNDLADLYVVKQSDAHSWAEVWLNGLGWVTMDPTPSDQAGSGAYESVPQTRTRYLEEYVRAQWQRWVIDFSPQKQAAIYQNLRESAGVVSLLEGIDELANRLPGGFFVSAPGTAEAEVEEGASPSRAPLFVLLALVLTVGGGVAAVIALVRRRRQRRAISEIDYLAALLKKLEKAGYQRKIGQTPGELVAELPEMVMNGGEVSVADIAFVVQVYYREKFSGVPAADEDRRRAKGVVDRLQFEPVAGGEA